MRRHGVDPVGPKNLISDRGITVARMQDFDELPFAVQMEFPHSTGESTFSSKPAIHPCQMRADVPIGPHSWKDFCPVILLSLKFALYMTSRLAQ